MKIAILSHSDYGGAAYFLYKAINRFTNHTAVHCRTRNCYINYPSVASEGSILDYAKWADVIHVHDTFKGLTARISKPIVMTYHGSMYRRKATDALNKRDKKNKWLQTVATIDLTLLGPAWLPDSRPPMNKYVNRSNRFLVCQAPTSRVMKGTDVVIDAMEGVNFDLIENLTWEQALKRKGKAWVTIDQFRLGYGCNAIEAWLMKQPVIANSQNEVVLDLIRSQLGFLPFVQCEGNKDSILATVERLRDDKAYYKEMAARGYEYATKIHSQQAVAKKAIEYYNKAIAMK